MIRKVKGRYKVISHITGRSFGTYKTKAEAIRRLWQIKFFGNIKKTRK
jgi:hypothetical protein